MERFILYLCFVIGLAITIYSCESENCENTTNGTLKNLTGLDGCSWVIEIDSDTRLEPVNLSEFITDPIEGKKVRFSYEDYEGFSICMTGQMITITCLE